MQYSKRRNPAKWMAAALLFVCGLQSALLPAQGSGNSERAAIEIISVEHRDPLFVRSQLMPLLDPRGDIALVDNKLIISSTAANLQQLKTLIAGADVPARRLVVSVDFAYGISRTGNASQQSSQALEGDLVSFTDASADGTSVEINTDVIQAQPQITINSTVQGDVVEADVEIFNVPGFSGTHSLTLLPGQWYLINPVDEVETVPALVPHLDTGEVQSTELMPPVPAPGSAPVAIRVDVLP